MSFPIDPKTIEPKLFTSLPMQVALNLALLLTGRRDAFQLDIEDIADDGQDRLISTVQQVVHTVAPHCHPLVVYKNSKDRVERSFWSILWVDHHRFGRERTFVESATNLLQFRDMDVVEATRRSSRTRSAMTADDVRYLKYELIGRMLGLNCSPRAFVSHKTHRYRIMIVTMKHPNDFPRTVKAQMCLSQPDILESLTRLKWDLDAFKPVATQLGLFVQGKVYPSQNLQNYLDYTEEHAFYPSYNPLS